MIVKITRGADMAGAVRYLMTDKQEVVREHPHVVTGLGRDGEALTAQSVRGLADELDAPRVLSGTEIKNGHVMHIALSFDEPLTEDQRRAVVTDFMERAGFSRERWVAVHHGVNSAGHDHVHVLRSMVREDGSRAPEWKYEERASTAATAVERAHGLPVVEARVLGLKDRGYHGAEKAIAERLHGKGTEPAPDYIRRVLRAATVETRDEQAYVRYLRERNVTAHPGLGGYSYSVPGSRQYQGSKLARDLSWPRIQERWQNPVPQTADQAAHRAAGRLAATSLRTERRPGPLARESRELGRFAQTRASAGPLMLSTAAAQLLRERIRAAEQRAREAEQARDELAEHSSAQTAPERGADLGY